MLRCSNIIRAALPAAVVAAMVAGEARAFLDTGTLLTNAAMAEYTVISGEQSSISYSATAKILVANPAVYLWKEATPTTVTSTAGGVINFEICFSNGGANTAFKLTIKDKLPNFTYYNGGYTSWYTDLGGGVNPVLMTWSNAPNGPWNTGAPPTSTASIYLQWYVPTVGVGKSGCVYFTVELR